MLARILLALCVAGCLRQDPAISKEADDSGVVNAAMLTLFGDADWISPDWKEGDFVVIDTQWSFNGKRPNFYEELEGAIQQAKASDKAANKNEFPILQRIKQQSASTEKSYEPTEVPQLRHLKLDELIVVSDIGWHPFRLSNNKVTNASGRTGSIRIGAGISPPGYSNDGKFACVIMGAPWSIHSARVTFFVERTKEGWKVLHVSPIFYV